MIALAAAAKAALITDCEARYPEEACGLLIGRGEPTDLRIDRIEPSANLAAAPQLEFEIDTKLRLDLTRALRTTPERIVGFYHSHPDGPAEPSDKDRARAWEADL